MSEAYITVVAILQDMPHEVNQWVKKGYTPLGGPIATGEHGISSAKFAQAMFKEPAVSSTLGRDFVIGKTQNDGRGDVGTQGFTWPTSEELEAAVHEANAAVPGSASSGYAPQRTIQDELSFAQLVHVLSPNGPLSFIQLPVSEQKALLHSAQVLFNDALAALRKKHQEPYTEYTEPKTSQDRYYEIQKLIRLRTGVLVEYAAACSARDSNAKPTIMVDLADAQKICSLLENSTRAQYPTEHQRAVERFKQRALGVQQDD